MQVSRMDRKEAIEILKRNKPTSDPRRCGTELCEAVGIAIEALRESERKKGKWLSELKEDGDSLLRCSICNYPVSYFWSRTNFCPECGADLKEKNNGKIKTEND